MDRLTLLADTVDATSALDEADDSPGKVEVDDNVGILQVLAFAEHVGGDEHAQLVCSFYMISLVVAVWAEAPCELRRIGTLACNAFDARYAA